MVSSYALALGASLFSLVLWGAWPSLTKASAGPWDRQYRLQSTGAVGVTVVTALIWSRGDVVFGPWTGVAVASGVLCSTGVMFLVAAIHLDGVYLAVPVSNGLGTALGTLLLYFLERGTDRETDAVFLFVGVAIVFLAVSLNSLSPLLRRPHNDLPVTSSWTTTKEDSWLVEKEEVTEEQPPKLRPGLVCAVASGLCFAAWPLLEDIAVLNGANLARHFLVPFAAGYALATLLILPVLASAANDDETEDPRIFFAVLAGATWAAGTICLLAAGVVLGDAVAVAVAQCNPMIASISGILLWDELRGASGLEISTVVGSLLLYLVGVTCFFLSSLLS